MINTVLSQNRINKKSIFFIVTGILIFAIIGYFNIIQSKIIDFPISVPFDYATDDYVNTTFDSDQLILLFRGVHALHPDLPNAKLGIASPIGGHSDPELHNFGNNKSVFTSWTTNIWFANNFATRNGDGGIILSKTFHRSRLIPSEDNFQQGEWLVSGIVTNAIPLPSFDRNIPLK